MFSKKPKPSAGDAGSGKNVGKLAASRVLPQIAVTRQGRRSIPRSDAAGAVAIYDGQQFLGTCVEHEHSHFAFDAGGTLIGEYATRLAALRALPRVRT